MIRPALLVLALLLAGCAGPTAQVQQAQEAGGTTAAPDAVPAQPDTGTLVVYALDAKLRPLADAEVTLADNRTQTTNGDGMARFEDVPAGTVLLTVSKEGYRTAQSGARVEPGREVQANVKLLEDETVAAVQAANEPRRDQYHFRGYFECSATYLIITGDCMLLADTVTEGLGLGTPAGNGTQEEFMLDFPLDYNWTSVVGEMHWDSGGPLNGEAMTFALEPTEYNSTGHAPKYARDEGTSPLRWVVHAGEAHPSATASADGDEPDMPDPFGGEVVRTRSYVAGQVLHRPAGTDFLGVGAAVTQQFEVVVTVFYGERAPEDFTVAGA